MLLPQRMLPRRQSGIALIAALIMLLVMTMFALLGMEETTLEERMVLNMRDRSVSLESGESTLRANERYLWRTVAMPFFMRTDDCATPPLCGGTTPVIWDIAEQDMLAQYGSWSWWASKGMEYRGSATDDSELYGPSAPARGIMQYDGFNLPSYGNSFGTPVTDPSMAAKGVGPHYFTVASAAPGLLSDNPDTVPREDVITVVESRFVRIE